MRGRRPLFGCCRGGPGRRSSGRWCAEWWSRMTPSCRLLGATHRNRLSSLALRGDTVSLNRSRPSFCRPADQIPGTTELRRPGSDFRRPPDEIPDRPRPRLLCPQPLPSRSVSDERAHRLPVGLADRGERYGVDDDDLAGGTCTSRGRPRAKATSLRRHGRVRADRHDGDDLSPLFSSGRPTTAAAVTAGGRAARPPRRAGRR